jgi:hypothetical protein
MYYASMAILSRVWLNPRLKIREIEKLKSYFILKITPSQSMNKSSRILEYLRENF